MHLAPRVRVDADPVQPGLQLGRHAGTTADAVDVYVGAPGDGVRDVADKRGIQSLRGRRERHDVGVHQRAHHLGRGVTRVEGASDVGVPGLVRARPALLGRCAHPQGGVAGVADRATEPGDRRR